MTRASPLADALAHLDDGELIALTRDLVRIPSVVRPGDPDATEAAVASYVAGWLAREGLTVEVQQVAPGRPNVLGWIGDPGAAPGRTLLLEGHTDVVTEGDAADWTFPPFGGVLAEGRIWGRGAADMKGGLAAAMVAAAAIRRSGVPLGGRLLVGALVDEEGDMLGVRHLCETPAGRALTGAIICEPEGNELCLEQRGVVWARVTARGRMAHGAMPEAAVNPIAAIAAVIGQAPALERRLRRLCARSRHVRPPTVTPTIIRSPLSGLPQSNVIPSSATATLDIRLTPGVDEKTLAEAIDETCQAAARAVPGVSVGWQPVSGFRMPTRVERTAPLVRAVETGVRRVTGRRPRYGGVPGSTDGTILFQELGIPIVTCGPGNRQIPHQVNEYVEVAELTEAARIYVAASLEYLAA